MMKFVAAAALVSLGAEASASLISPFSKFRTNEANANEPAFLLDGADLTTLVDDPPSFVSRADSSYGFAADIVSLGSVTRMDYLTSQIETWASHRAVRHFWGFSELQDYDPECSAMSDAARAAIVDTCKASMAVKDPKIQSFFSEYYGLSEGHRERSNDAGWICAQRRVGRAFGWLHSQYAGGKATIPEYLILVDDDTYVDLVDVMAYLEKEDQKAEGRAFARAGCVFPRNEVIPFPLSYGGFGTILNKAAIRTLSEPIHCGEDVSEHQETCAQIKADTVGEAAVFRDGMTIFELFYKYSALKDFCMHSDWLLGYVLEYYLPHSLSNAEHKERDHTLMGMMNYPSCGNVTVATGSVRRCTHYSDTCHNQGPKDMEALAISSFAQSPESYKAIPKMELTDLNVAMGMVKSNEYDAAETARLPNVFLLGASDAGSSEIAEFLSSNGVCRPGTLDDKSDSTEHFFDREDLYNRGFGFYSKGFEHCSQHHLVMDASPFTLKYPERVYDMYHQVNPDSPSNLKVIAVLRESNPGEYGSFLETWASVFDRQQVLVLSSSELHQYPQRSQWRIEQFLGETFEGLLESVDAGNVIPSDPLPTTEEERDGFYQFMDESQGPWMEQHPFPRVVAPKTFAYTSVLGWNPDGLQNALYLDATRILIRSLKNSAADFIVLMMYKDEEAEEALRADGANVKYISPVKHSLDVTYFEPWFVDIALAKLRAFELTEYKRVQVLDVDSLVLDVEMMDNLFTSFNNANLVSEGLGSDSPLRAGWLLIQPSLQDFNSMQQLLERGVFTCEHGWDNLDLPVQYPGWHRKSSSNNWEFYGSQLEQGLLYHQFFAFPKSVDPSAEDSELLTLLDDETLHSLGFVHFYGDSKPWVKNIDDSSLPTHVALAKSRWLKEFKDLSSVPAPGHTSPLTRIGIKQYQRALALYSPTSSPSSAPVSSAPITPAPVNPAPTPSPTISPVSAPLTTINVLSTVEWNYTCPNPPNNTLLLEVANTIEVAVFNKLDPELTGQQRNLIFVYVSQLCNQLVDSHSPYTGSRRLVDKTSVEIILGVSEPCTSCEDTLVNATVDLLETIVNNGTLASEISSISNGVIDASFTPNSTVSQQIPVTDSPSASPSTSPVSSAPVSGAPVSSAPVSGAPVSSAPVSGAPVSSAPVSGAPVSSAPVSGAPCLRPGLGSAGVFGSGLGAPVSSARSRAPVSSARSRERRSPVSSAPASGAPVSSAPVSERRCRSRLGPGRRCLRPGRSARRAPVSSARSRSAGVFGSGLGSAGVFGSGLGSAGVFGSGLGSAGVFGSGLGSAGVFGSVSGAPVSSARSRERRCLRLRSRERRCLRLGLGSAGVFGSVSGAPVSSAPVSGAPVSSAPVSGAPVSSAPVSGAPISPAPVNTVPLPPTAIPTSKPTTLPTPQPQAKSGKQSKASVPSPLPTRPPTPPPVTARPTASKATKSSKRL
eukprot:CCRYP_002359-RA/>CCRYP_002359-RA protein AED:0.09 eAED:0.14 QI:151/0.85/0.75/1/0.85/0.75/8/502/1448